MREIPKPADLADLVPEKQGKFDPSRDVILDEQSLDIRRDMKVRKDNKIPSLRQFEVQRMRNTETNAIQPGE